MTRRHLILPGLAVLIACVPALLTRAGEEHCQVGLGQCVEQLVANARSTGWLGIEIEYPEPGGYPVVRRVIPTSPAAEAGMKAGDVLLEFNGLRYNRANKKALQAEHATSKVPGATVVYRIQRQDREIEMEVQLAEVPEPVLAQWIGYHVLHSHGVTHDVRASKDD